MNLKLCNNIKKFRREKNLTQDELATQLGISYQAVSRWETGLSYPDVELLPSLAAILGVSMDLLFGMDAENEERKIDEYLKACEATESADEQIKLTREIMTEFPANTYLKSRLISRYRYKGSELPAGRLEELRKLCRFIIENTTDMDWWRDKAICDMIALEDNEDSLQEWLSALDNRAIITSEKALIQRYDHRNEIDQFNEAIQKDIVRSLTDIFDHDFCKRDAKTYKNAQSRAEGQKLILQTIDVFRDPSKEIDAWLETRMFAYLRLAAGLFGSDQKEEGYAALEKAVDLYMAYDQLPNGTELGYHCSALDMLKVKIEREDSGWSECAYALWILTEAEGWEWLNGVRTEERFLEQAGRLKAFCEQDTK